MRIYIDTSVFGGCFDEEFEEWSLKLFKQVSTGKYKVVISDVIEEELRVAPAHVREVLKDLPRRQLEVVKLTDGSKALAQAYVKERIVTAKWKADTEHIAVATIAQVDLLVSWNFKHIVNFDRIRLYNAVNLKLWLPAAGDP